MSDLSDKERECLRRLKAAGGPLQIPAVLCGRLSQKGYVQKDELARSANPGKRGLSWVRLTPYGEAADSSPRPV